MRSFIRSIIRESLSGFNEKLYHGTKSKFDKFDLSFFNSGSHDGGWLGKGIYLTNELDYAESYAHAETDGHVLECQVMLKNPLVLHDHIYSISPLRLMNEFGADTSTELTSILKEKGYDGVVLTNHVEKEHFIEACVFDPANVRILNVMKESLTEIRDDSALDATQLQIKNIEPQNIWFRQLSSNAHHGTYELRLRPKELDLVLLQKEKEETGESTYPAIDIEFDNCNKIHIGGLPEYFLNLGLGKKAYEKICSKLGLISSTGDRSGSVQRVWESLERSSMHYYVKYERRDFLVSKQHTEHSLGKVREYVHRWNAGEPSFTTLPPKLVQFLTSPFSSAAPSPPSDVP